MDILIKGGRLLDPANDRDGLFDIRIRDGKILKVMEPSTEKEEPRTGSILGNLFGKSKEPEESSPQLPCVINTTTYVL